MKTLQRMNATKPAAAHSSTHALGVLAVLALALCLTMVTPVIASAADAPLQVSVSIPPQKYFVERIGGDLVRTTVMVPPGADPHTYEPKPSQLRGLSGSRIYFSIGAPFEDAWLARIVAAAGPSLSVVPMHKGVTLLPAAAPLHNDEAEHAEGKEHHEDHHAHADGHGHDHGTTDPHVWLSPMLVRHMSLAIRDALAKADPDGAKTYTANAGAFKAKLKTLEEKVAALKAAHAGDGVAITEPVPDYLLEAAGLENRTPEEFSEAVEEEGDVPPRAMRDILALLTGKKVKALVYYSQPSGPQTEQVEKTAEESGVPVVPVTETLPEGTDYITWMDGNIAALGKALS